jgi:two-component system sensor histidine kinase BaeS
MKLRRRVLIYFILLIFLSSTVNLAISYYLTQALMDRFHESVRSAFLQQATTNLLVAYEKTGSLATVSEDAIRPHKLSIHLPRRWGRVADTGAVVDVTVDNGWNIVVADSAGHIVFGADQASMREEPGNRLETQGKSIGMMWLAPNPNSTWELIRKYLFISLLFRNFLTALVSSALALGIAFMFSDYLARHIGELALAARKIAGGQLDFRVKDGARDELGQLVADFNAMANKLQEDQQLRRQLQADIVHELRTPLAVCQAVLDSLESGAIEWNTKTLASLQEETSRMNRLVTDLHELNRAENRQLPLYKELFSVGDLIDRLEESCSELARKKDIDFSIQAVNGARATILYADPDRIMQVFLNILHNALRHTPAGGTITMRIWPKGGTTMAFAIADNGEGIAAEALPHIFDRFFSGDKSRSRSRSGTGLGLAIAKEYALLHGGDIEVRSVIHQGTEFIVALPCEQEPGGKVN